MGHVLKKEFEAFQVVDGPFAGKTFQHGKEYADVPPGEVRKFEKTESKNAVKKTAKKMSAKGGDK